MTPLRDGQAEARAHEGAGPRVVAARHEAHELVLGALDALPNDQQEAFRLKFNDELTYREISQVMGKSLGTVSNLITAAMTTIRQQLRTNIDLVQEG